MARILQSTARKPAQYRGKHDDHYGAGIIDAEAALRQALRGARVVAVAGPRPCRHVCACRHARPPQHRGAGLAMAGSLLCLLFIGLGLRRRAGAWVSTPPI